MTADKEDTASESASLDSIFVGLGDPKHLQREKALNSFISWLNSEPVQSGSVPRESCLPGLKALLQAQPWERKLGGLMAAKAYVATAPASEFDGHMVEECLRLLEDGEVRVRLAVGECLAILAARRGMWVYERCSGEVLRSIHENFEREDGEDAAEPPGSSAGSSPRGSISGSASGGDLIGALLQQTYRVVRPGSGELRHGTEGWKCLETSMRALQLVVASCSPSDVRPHLTPDVRDLLYRCLHHPNRFVRETGHVAMCTLCKALAGPELGAVGRELAPRLRDGLSDNWSQVRYSAAVATRAFMESLNPEQREEVMEVLLPPMCLNRYYVAEGVRLYSQETWRRVMGDTGRAQVCRHLEAVVDYYVAQSKANNHAVREAACACIAELPEKVEREAVSPHIPALLRALLLCFKDMSWPVRDAACTACGRCVLSCPSEARPFLQELLALWTAHLWDNIPSVRSNSAVALANAVRAYGEEVLAQLLPVVSTMLPMAQQQPPESVKYSELSNATTFGVAARKARDNDPGVHTDQEMFSCGSLTSRFSTSYLIKSDGCMDFGFSRGKQPWEASDGAAYMLRELSAVAPQAVPPLLPGLADVARIATFQHAFNLHETVWRCLPTIAKNLGKPVFKPHLESFLPPLFSDLGCGHQLAEAAAARAVAELRDWLGHGIFAGRLSEGQRAVMESPKVAAAIAAAGAARPAGWPLAARPPAAAATAALPYQAAMRVA